METSPFKKILPWPLTPFGLEREDHIDTEQICFVRGSNSLSEEEIIAIALVLHEYTPTVVNIR